MNGIANTAKGRAVGYVDQDAGGFGVLILKTSATDAVLKDLSTVTEVLAGTSVEADFTNYARITGITATASVDDADDSASISIPVQTWTSAGGALNNTIAKLLVFFDNGSELQLVSFHDFVATTDGSDLSVSFAAPGFFKSS